MAPSEDEGNSEGRQCPLVREPRGEASGHHPSVTP